MPDSGTLPHHNFQSNYPVAYPRRRSTSGCGIRAGVSLLVMLFACIAMSALYIAFPPPRMNIVVVGLDARPGEQLLTRSDANIVMGIDPGGMNTALMSIPRDLFITMPDYGLQRINTINALAEQELRDSGGLRLSESIELSFQINIDRYIRLDFGGFMDLVNAVGGIDVYVERRIVDYQYPTPDFGVMTIEFNEGWQHMDGFTALAYARTRYSDDDYARAGRQQAVVKALALRLMNPLVWIPASAVIQQSIDTNLSVFEMLGILPPILFNGGQFEQLVIDRDLITNFDGYATPNYSAIAGWLDANLR